MSSYSEVLEERGGLRVRLVADVEDIPPEADGEPALVRIEQSGKASHVQRGDDEAASYVESAIERTGLRPSDEGWCVVEKYMRAYLGVTAVQTWHGSNGDWYVAYDTPEWHQYAGAGEVTDGTDLFGDWKSYVEGDVWGYVVEKHVTWSSEGYGDRDTWEAADVSGWSLYGCEYAETEARAAFKEMAGE